MKNPDFETELLIQRCVDDELSREETRHLLRRLDGMADGWKSLACGLLENRGLTKLFRSDAVNRGETPGTASSDPLQCVAQPGVAVDSEGLLIRPSSGVTPASGDAEIMRQAAGGELPRVLARRRLMAHPLISLTLCAAIAFVGGLLIPDLRPPDSLIEANNAMANSGATGSATERRSDVKARLGEYRVEMQPGERRIEVPLVSDIQQLDSDHPLFSDPADGGDNVRWILVPVEGNRSMLIPVSSDSAGDMQ